MTLDLLAGIGARLLEVVESHTFRPSFSCWATAIGPLSHWSFMLAGIKKVG